MLAMRQTAEPRREERPPGGRRRQSGQPPGTPRARARGAKTPWPPEARPRGPATTFQVAGPWMRVAFGLGVSNLEATEGPKSPARTLQRRRALKRPDIWPDDRLANVPALTRGRNLPLGA
jgi:hypothetical protein